MIFFRNDQNNNLTANVGNEIEIIEPEQKIGKQKYYQKYKSEWESNFNWIKNVNKSAFCKFCFVTLANNKTLLKRHEESTYHKRN